MAINSQEIIDELKSVISGRTFDAVLPPLVFVFTNNLFNLNIAAIIALSLAAILAIRRFIKGENWFYALGGCLVQVWLPALPSSQGLPLVILSLA